MILVIHPKLLDEARRVRPDLEWCASKMLPDSEVPAGDLYGFQFVTPPPVTITTTDVIKIVRAGTRRMKRGRR